MPDVAESPPPRRRRPRTRDPEAESLAAIGEAVAAAVLLTMSFVTLLLTFLLGWIAAAIMAATSVLTAVHAIFRGRSARRSMRETAWVDRRGARTAEALGFVVLAAWAVIGVAIPNYL